MKTMSISKYISALVVALMMAVLLPETSSAQRFGHGGGGGFGGARGGAPARGSGGFGGGRTINGGSRNIGNHPVFRAPEARPARPFGGILRNDNVYHRGFGAHPYFYHPYHPYFWGPLWHPFGFYCAVLTANAIMFDWANQAYYYDNGVYYIPSGNGYTSVAPPVGAVVTYLPAGYETVYVGDDTYYYYGGVFYVSQGGSFRVVAAPPGAVVSEIPDGATQQNINGETFLLYNNTYYQPISQNGQDAYEVVQMN